MPEVRSRAFERGGWGGSGPAEKHIAPNSYTSLPWDLRPSSLNTYRSRDSLRLPRKRISHSRPRAVHDILVQLDFAFNQISDQVTRCLICFACVSALPSALPPFGLRRSATHPIHLELRQSRLEINSNVRAIRQTSAANGFPQIRLCSVQRCGSERQDCAVGVVEALSTGRVMLRV